jgi:Flp pilus assembly protein TadD
MKFLSNKTASLVAIHALVMLTAVCRTNAQGVPAMARSSQSPWQDPIFRAQFVGSYGIASEIEPELTEADQATLKGLEPLMENRKDEAIAMLESTWTTDSNPRFALILGNLYLEKQSLANAERWLQTAIGGFPNYRQAIKNLGLLKAQDGKFAEAVKYLAKTLELGDADGAAYGLLGRCYLSGENSVAAETAFRQAVMLQPEVADWRKGLLASLVKQGKTSDAIALLDELIAVDPTKPELYKQQASVYMVKEDFASAALVLEIAGRLGEPNAEDLHRLGDLYVRREIPDLAYSAYSRAIKADANQPVDKCIRAAEILASIRAPEKATQLLAEIRSQFGAKLESASQARMFKIEARLALTRKADDEAAKLLREVVDKEPLDGEAWMLLGKYHLDKNEPEKSIFSYERAASVEKFAPDAKVKIAQIYVSQSKFDDAVQLLKEAQEKSPRDTVARYLEQVEKIAKARGNAPRS